jgi:enamine deaminase RidA (YjgF/YER057c/UK114 family)
MVVVSTRETDTAYISGSRAPVGTIGTEAQTTAVLTHISDLLKSKGMGMGDVVMMRVFLNPDPKKGGHADREGRDAAFRKFFGTAAQPNKPARTTVAVVDAAGDNLVEIDVVAVKAK